MGHVQNTSDSVVDEEDEDSPLLGSRLGRSYGQPENNGSVPVVKHVDIDQFNKSRWRSIRVMYLSVFLGAITFTITMSSLWPFLQVLDSSTKSSFLGWVVASYSLGQLISSPLFGAWANYRQSSKEPLTISLIMMCLSNLFYCYLQSMPNNRDLYMILARGLIGFSAGNVAVVRSYVSGATTLQERTSAMANLSMCQAMGFILGPVFQSILVLVKYPGPVELAGFHFNMYTAPAFFAASVALFNVVLFLVIFKEYRLNDEDEVNANVQKTPTEDSMEKSMDAMCHSNSHDPKEYKLDMLAVLSSIYLFFVVLFMFTVFETIGTPLTMHMYAWSKSKATFYQGILLGSGGCLSVCVFAGTKYLAKKYSERNLLLMGFLFCLGGYFSFIPWGHRLPPTSMAPLKNISRPTSSEAIFYMVNDLLYEHKHAFGGAHTKNLNDSENTLFQLPAYMNKNHNLERRNNYTTSRELYNSEHLLPASQTSHFSYKLSFLMSYNDSTISNNAIHGDDDDDDDDIDKNDKSTSNIMTKTSTRRDQSKSSSTTPTTTPIVSTTTSNISTTVLTPSNHTVTPEGCPWQYGWCTHVPMIPLPQYIFASFVITVGYPMCNMLTYTIYSKVLGPKPQGLWMGWLTASGSLARTVGPIYVSQIYDSFGPQVTYASITCYVGVTILFYLIVFRRLVPFSYTSNPRAPLLFWRKRNRQAL